jgi:hypothetical protein
MSSAIGSVSAFMSTTQNALSSGSRKAVGAPPEPPDPAEMFSKIDTDGDGKLSTDELNVFQQEMGKNAPPEGAKGPKPPDASQMMSDMDTDGDGAISQDEWTTFMEKMQQGRESKITTASSYSSQGASRTAISSSVLDTRV